MPNEQNEPLFALVKSLTKAEKRHFKLYASRTQESSDGLKFIQLFNIMDKAAAYEDGLPLKKMDGLSKSQLANLKRHLYRQLLTSLRLLHAQKNIDIEIREQFDYARILYGKGLYMQALKLLDRYKAIARENHLDLLHLEILEFQKLIEERHITRSRSVENKMENLVEEAERRSRVILHTCLLSNLKIEVHGYYIKHGHVRTRDDAANVRKIFGPTLRQAEEAPLTFFEKVYLHQAYVWFYYILLDFPNCYRHAKKWTQLFEQAPRVQSEDPDLYMRGLHYVLTALYSMGDSRRFVPALSKFADFERQQAQNFNQSSEILAFLYLYTSKLNRHFLLGSFKEGLGEVPFILQQLDAYKDYIDIHRVLVFHYKIAYLFLGAGHYEQALDYLNSITQLNAGHLREDIQCYARLLQLMAHYELGNFELLEYMVAAAQRFLEKVKELNEVQRGTLRLFKQIVRLPLREHKAAFAKFREALRPLESDRHAMRDFLYLDVPLWLDAKIKGKPLAEVLRLRSIL
jgi:hypothetical protein